MILVTGGTGFVGVHLLRALCKSYSNIIAIYRSGEKLEKIREFIVKKYPSDTNNFLKIKWKKANILDVLSLDNVFKNVKYVYHCAGMVSFNLRDEKKVLKINYEGTKNIVNISLKHKIKKILYVSSIAAISDIDALKYNFDKNNLGYGFSKHRGEMEIWRGIQEGVSGVIIHPGIILGDFLLEKKTSNFINYALRNRIFYPIGGSGFVMIDDVVSAMIKLLNSKVESKSFILVAENLTYKYVLNEILMNLKNKKYLIKIGWIGFRILLFMDILISVLSFRKKKLNRSIVKSLSKMNYYDGKEIMKIENFTYSSIEKGIASVLKRHKAMLGE